MSTYSKIYYYKNRERILAQHSLSRSRKKAGLPMRPRLNPLSSTKQYTMLLCAKHRAKKTGKEFNLVYEDIVIPDVCPVLGIPISITNSKGFRDSSPTLDRKDSSKGYTKGNVFVISWRANKLKSDATVEEMEAIIRYMQE